MIRPKCSDCIYWRRAEARVGECRRFPPQVYATASPREGGISGTDIDVREKWPDTADADWCGEWRDA